MIAVTTRAAREKLAALGSKNNVKVLVVNEGLAVDLVGLMGILGAESITSVLVEGGALIHGSAFRPE
ncbi:MAG: dihydrofolate reductase family protein [Candidatus Syntrophopropionicum ammoniitolerans]